MIIHLRIMFGAEYRNDIFLDFLSAITPICSQRSSRASKPDIEDRLELPIEYQESQLLCTFFRAARSL
jgi:hypothetical protein